MELEDIFTLKEERQQLKDKERKLLSPHYTDVNLIPKIYDLYLKILDKQACPPRHDSINTRKKFIFIVLLLFTPEKFAGGRIDGSVREKLSDILKCSKSAISHQCDDIIFLYQHYKNFKYGVNDIIEKITSTIKD
jgi:hypothetical protein